MKRLGCLIVILLLVFSTAGLHGARADEADEAYKTGLKYYNGEGVPQDYAKAMKYFRKAAFKDYTASKFTIGLKYNKGADVTQNYAEALKWFRKAADQGDAAAQVKDL